MSRCSLLLNCVGCLEIEAAYSFYHDGRPEDGGLVTSPRNPLVSHVRCASQLIQIRSQSLHPGGYRPFKVIQGNIVKLAHSDEPYMQKYGKLMENRFHELEHVSKVRLLKTHFHTSEQRGYEADRERQEKGKQRKLIH